MAKLVFQLGFELRGGALKTSRHKERIVAKAAGAPRRPEDGAIPRSTGHKRRSILSMAYEDNHTLIARGAPLLRYTLQLLQKFFVVLSVARLLAGIARGIDTGPASERIDLNAGIVGKRRQARQPRGITSLQQCVLEKGAARFRRGLNAERALGRELETERAQQCGQLTELSGIAARKDHAHARYPKRA